MRAMTPAPSSDHRPAQAEDETDDAPDQREEHHQHARDRIADRANIADIGEHVRRNDEVGARTRVLLAEKLRNVTDRQRVVVSLEPRLLDHLRRQIDANKPIDVRAERRAREKTLLADASRGEALRSEIHSRRRQLGHAIRESSRKEASS